MVSVNYFQEACFYKALHFYNHLFKFSHMPMQSMDLDSQKELRKEKKILNPFIVTVKEVQDRMRSVRLPANGRKCKQSEEKRARQGSDSQRYLENGKNGHRTNRKRDRSH